MDTSVTWLINIFLIVLSIVCFIAFFALSLLFENKKSKRWQLLFNNLAFICIPLIVIGVLDRLFLIRYFIEDTKILIHESLVEPFDSYVGSLVRYGVKNVHEPIDLKIVFDQMEKGGTLSILDTMLCDFDKTLTNVKDALDRGGKVRVLVIHPDAHVTKLRAEEVGPEWDYDDIFRPAIYKYIVQFRAVVKDYAIRSKRIEMRYYEDLPCMPLYILDNPGEDNDKLYHGYFLGEPSSQMPHVEIIPMKGGLYDSFLRYFNEKWKRNAKNVIDLSVFSGVEDLPPPVY
jgi:hypothetical protein